MKSLLALLALGLLAVGAAACGGSGSSKNAASASRVSSQSTTVATNPPDTASPAVASRPPHPFTVPKATRRDLEKYDRDEDDYVHVPDDNNPAPTGFTAASPSDKQAITALVKRYYAAALAGDGARGCSMFSAQFAKAIPLDYGKLGPAFLRRAKRTCPGVMSVYFTHEHTKLAREVPRMAVVRVSVNGNQGVAFLRFGALHERGITEIREGGAWKISAVLDGELE
jgi:hypothetical protein